MLNRIANAVKNLRDGFLVFWDPGGRAVIQCGYWVRPGRAYIFRIKDHSCEIEFCGLVRYSHLLSGLLRRFEIGLEVADFAQIGGRPTDLQLSTPGTIRVIGRPRLIGMNWVNQFERVSNHNPANRTVTAEFRTEA